MKKIVRNKNYLQNLANIGLLILFVLIITACSQTETTPANSTQQPTEETTYWPAAGWSTSTPEEQDMDGEKLQQMMDLIDEQGFAYDSVVVVRNGHIVFEQYRNGYSQNRRHHLQSATKSFSSMLIGIAIHEGFIGHVNEKLVDLLPEHPIANMDARKENVTLEHLLTMSDGLDWHELDYPYSDPRNTLGQMWVSDDAVQHVLDQPMVREPGEAWVYNSGTSILLGGILEQATDGDVLSFAREYLFDPIGIGEVYWEKTTGNHYHTDGGLWMTPRDMARFGYLMLNNGTWDGREIVSPEWIEQSSQAHYLTSSGNGYGYQWWTMEHGIYAARGHYEQNIYVIPQADMVVVFTGAVPDDVLHPTDGLTYSYILAACNDLPEDATRQEYDNYGITIEYPAGFSILESPQPGTTSLDNSSGILQLRLDSYPFELIQVMWSEAEPGLDPLVYFDQVIESMLQQSGVEYSPGTSWESTMDRHKVIHQYFDFADHGIQLRGVTGVWYCDETGRVVAFSYATNPEVSDQDLKTRYLEHLDSLACHEVR